MVSLFKRYVQEYCVETHVTTTVKFKKSFKYIFEERVKFRQNLVSSSKRKYQRTILVVFSVVLKNTRNNVGNWNFNADLIPNRTYKLSKTFIDFRSNLKSVIMQYKTFSFVHIFFETNRTKQSSMWVWNSVIFFYFKWRLSKYNHQRKLMFYLTWLW